MLERITNKGQLLERAMEAWEDASMSDGQFQRNAREAFAYRDGWGQWDKVEKDILAEERRPALTLNVLKSHIDLVMGLNEDLKKRHTCRPVAVEDAFLCEVLNNVNYWLYQKSDWEAEEDLAFESALICGRGWVNIDYDIDEKKLNEIKITQTSIPVHEIRFDPAARKRDLSDASYIIWDRWFSLEDFCVKFPKHEKLAREALAEGKWPQTNWVRAIDDGDSQVGNDINDESDYDDPLDVNYFDTKKKLLRVAHMEYCKYVKKWFYWNPEEREWMPVPGKLKDFKEKEFPAMFPGRQLVLENTLEKEVWWLQFCGKDVMVHAKSPLAIDGFSIVPVFLFSDVSRRSPDHYGIVEQLKDTQLELNKRASQTLNLFNQQVQPGVYAEANTFVNVDQAEQSLKEAGSITWLQDGAMSQGKFQERTVPNFPTAVLQMGEYMREMMRYISGINPDLMGMNDKRKEPGIVVQLRQQQGMAILKPVFRAYTFMRKQLFERQVRIIMAHMPSSQVKKILGEGDRYQVKKGGIIVDTKTGLECNFRNVTDADYDIDAEPESNSLTQNALEIATYMEMQQQGMVVDPKVVVSKTNLPVTQKMAWLDYIDQQQQSAAEANEQAMALEKQKLEQQHEREMAKIESNMQISMAKLGLQEEKDQLKAAMDQEGLQAEIARSAQEAQLAVAKLLMDQAAGEADRKLELMDLMLDADHKRKKLILDTMEIMAQAKMAGDELAMNLVRDMYKAAMDASESNKQHKVTLLSKALDVMGKGRDAVVKAKTEIAKEVIKGKLAERTAKMQAKNQGGSDNGAGK